MSKKNRVTIAGLLALNAVLLLLLLVSYFRLPKAYGQVRASDYMLIPGRVSSSEQTVWVMDLASMQLTSCTYQRGSKSIRVGEILDVAAQFGR